MTTKESGSKPIVTLSHIVTNIIDGGTQYFAYPNDPTQIPENAIWVSLGNTDNNWIEIHPVDEVDIPTTDGDFEVVLDDDYPSPSPSWVLANTENSRWFAEKDK